MKRAHQDLLLVAIGVFVLGAVAKGVHLHLVKPLMTVWLVLSGIVLVALGAVGLIGRGRHHGHEATRVGWAFAVPFVVLALVPPAPLGAFAAGRDASQPRALSTDLLPLPQVTVSGAVDMSMSEFVGRSQLDGSATMAQTRFRLVGFVAPADPSRREAGWLLTRIAVSCCAADGYAVRVRVRNAPTHPSDTWLEVTGRWAGMTDYEGIPIPVLDADDVRVVPQPQQPYDI